MGMMVRLVLAVCVMSTLLVTPKGQTCKKQTLASNTKFLNCQDLPQLTSYLHWTYNDSSNKLDIAFRHGGITSTDRWVAWAINKKNELEPYAMPGAQALVAIPQSNGIPKVYTSSIASTATQLEQSQISYPVSGLSATYQNNEVTIYASITLPKGTTSIVHLWQDGPLSGSTPQEHSHIDGHNNSKQSLQLLSGQTQSSSGGGSKMRKRNTHGVLNAVSWGILMPVGALIARYLKVFKSAGAAWFYLHITCQASAYIVGVAGLGTGFKLDSQLSDIDAHRALGVILVVLGTLQVFALFLRPNPDHKYRLYWNMYHHFVGYATIAISIANVFKGFHELQNFGDYKNWKHAYVAIIATLAGIAAILEIVTWIIVLKRRKSESKGVNGVNGYGNGVNEVNGYGSRP